MPNQLRDLRDRPLPPARARPAFLLSAVAIVLVAVVLIATGRSPQHERPVTTPVATVATAPTPPSTAPLAPTATVARQDPQDVRGSRAASRAHRALVTHRALQHVPYRAGGVAIDLTGAHDGRAVLAVVARSRRQARAGWLRFLARYHDAGHAYEARLKVTRSRDRLKRDKAHRKVKRGRHGD